MASVSGSGADTAAPTSTGAGPSKARLPAGATVGEAACAPGVAEATMAAVATPIADEAPASMEASPPACSLGSRLSQSGLVLSGDKERNQPEERGRREAGRSSGEKRGFMGNQGLGRDRRNEVVLSAGQPGKVGGEGKRMKEG